MGLLAAKGACGEAISGEWWAERLSSLVIETAPEGGAVVMALGIVCARFALSGYERWSRHAAPCELVGVGCELVGVRRELLGGLVLGWVVVANL